MRTSDVDSAQVFVVRVTNEGGAALRGYVREGSTGAYCAFTSWPELTSFLADQVRENRRNAPDRAARHSASKEKR
jgi:hypothetical protein